MKTLLTIIIICLAWYVVSLENTKGLQEEEIALITENARDMQETLESEYETLQDEYEMMEDDCNDYTVTDTGRSLGITWDADSFKDL